MSNNISKIVIASLCLSAIGIANAGHGSGKAKLSFFNQHSLKPSVVTDAQCAEGPSSVYVNMKSTKPMTIGPVTYSGSSHLKMGKYKKGIFYNTGFQHEVVRSDKGKVVYKSYIYFAGVGVKDSHDIFGAYSDGYCGGNFTLEYHHK